MSDAIDADHFEVVPFESLHGEYRASIGSFMCNLMDSKTPAGKEWEPFSFCDVFGGGNEVHYSLPRHRWVEFTRKVIDTNGDYNPAEVLRALRDIGLATAVLKKDKANKLKFMQMYSAGPRSVAGVTERALAEAALSAVAMPRITDSNFMRVISGMGYNGPIQVVCAEDVAQQVRQEIAERSTLPPDAGSRALSVFGIRVIPNPHMPPGTAMVVADGAEPQMIHFNQMEPR